MAISANSEKDCGTKRPRTWIFTLSQSSVDDLHVHLDLGPVRGRQHLLPDQSDLFQTRRDFVVVQLQPLVVEAVLRRCKHTSTLSSDPKHTHLSACPRKAPNANKQTRLKNNRFKSIYIVFKSKKHK